MKTKIHKVSLDSLKRDFRYYPRQAVSVDTINRFIDAMEAGAVFPPMRVCAKTGRIIDGFHRYGAYTQLKIETVEVVPEEPKDDREFFTMAVEANKAHGLNYCFADYQRIASIAAKLGLEREKISLIASIPIQKLSDLTRNIPASDPAVHLPLKGHANKPRAERVMSPLSTHSEAITFSGFIFYCNQVIRFMRSDLCDMANKEVFDKIRELEACIIKQLNPVKLRDLVCEKIRQGAATYGDLSIELNIPQAEIKTIVKDLIGLGRVKEGHRGGKGEKQRGKMAELLSLVDDEIPRIPDNRMQHPAIVAFKTATGFYPKRMLFDKVIEVLGDSPDVTRLNQVFVAWTGRGFNPINLNFLDWYIDGVPSNGNGKKYETASARNVRHLEGSLDYLAKLPSDGR